MINKEISVQDYERLRVLAEIFPNISQVCKEIINLKAILNLPKGTEHFISDLHGEYDTFYHILNNCSGVIKEKAVELFSGKLSRGEIEELCTLIYYPDEKLRMYKEQRMLTSDRYKLLLKLLTEFAVYISDKYTRSKVRKALPGDFSYIIDEMMHAQKDEYDHQIQYHEHIYQAIIETGAAEQIINALIKMIKRLAVDHLHIVGDIFDRGSRADKIINTLKGHHSLDIQWGNHDIMWMGAAAGNEVMAAAVVFLSLKYNSYQILENGYGISLRRLITFAEKGYPYESIQMSAKKAIAAIMFKLEGQLLMRHPEYELDDRLLLDKIDFKNYTVSINGKTYPLEKADFVTVDPAAPYALTDEEQKIVDDLTEDFRESQMLQSHISFLYDKGNMYTVFNDNILYHGCVPLDNEGNFAGVKADGRIYKGKALLDYCELCARSAYFEKDRESLDFMWYLWGGINSPVSGRVVKTFERTYIKDKETWTEPVNAYYGFINDEKTAAMVLREFNLFSEHSHIINGHTPIHASSGESPIKAGGKVIVIDGGFCKAYHNKTGIAGYTLIFNSKGLRIKAHNPFDCLDNALNDNADIISDSDIVEEYKEKLYVKDTDNGKNIAARISDLEKLLACYRNGSIAQK